MYPPFFCNVGWGCKIHPLHPCRGIRPSVNECSECDTKKSDGKVPVILKFWGMWSTPSLPSLPVSLWLAVEEPERVISMGKKELNCILMLNIIISNRTVFIWKLRTYAKLTSLKQKCFEIKTAFT